MYLLEKDDEYVAFWDIPEKTYTTLRVGGFNIMRVDGIDHGTAQYIMLYSQADLKKLWQALDDIVAGKPMIQLELTNKDNIVIKRKDVKKI